MKTLKKILSACFSALLLVVAPPPAILPPGDVKVVDDDRPQRRGANPVWLLFLAGYLIVIWLDIEASGVRAFRGRIWTERIMILLLLVRVFLLERRLQRHVAVRTPEERDCGANDASG